MEYTHSVSLDREKCKGCTNCLKRCPTQAIRIRDGHAVINSKHCIDCGECIRVCPYKAKTAIYDKWEDLDTSKYLIALPAPSFFGQFSQLYDGDYLMTALINAGFSDVFEVAKAAEVVTEYTRRYMKRADIPRPVISSACPVIVRLISLRFPFLCDNVMTMMPPIEMAGKMARQRAKEQHPQLSDDDIKTVFISPCPAKVSWVKNSVEGETSPVDYVLSMSDVYFRVLDPLKEVASPTVSSETGMIGMSWASTGGESTALMNDRYLAADGIENVIRVLDDIETGHFPNLEYVELNACNGGCVGGVLTVENPYIARVRLQTLRRYLPVSRNRLPVTAAQKADEVPDELFTVKPLQYRNTQMLDEDRKESIRKMRKIEEILEGLPTLDCGSCGAPSCRAFAEDIVMGDADETQCIVRMREKLQSLLEQQMEGNK
ncbi:MAG: [Fe-Fe] hydrogenase large subunit C-terminal domain-containing protein [Eubacteriales bacterium]|nr:[Fe-Fe] hydrogenase large subunit C-terminal domain-containing protein [Eubacteriales bacterium]